MRLHRLWMLLSDALAPGVEGADDDHYKDDDD